MLPSVFRLFPALSSEFLGGFQFVFKVAPCLSRRISRFPGVFRSCLLISIGFQVVPGIFRVVSYLSRWIYGFPGVFRCVFK